ncbi:outer membrane lipoprotein carrier protein LolA [Bacteroidota bacterium]
MQKLLFIVLFSLAIQGALSQKDPDAKKILDKVSSQSMADYPISVSFEYIYEDLMEKQTTTESGTLILEEKKFRLSIGESLVYSDGISVWNYIASANEAYISDAEEGNMNDEFFITNPSDLFTFYQEGFKYRLTGEIEYDGHTYVEIDIFPEDLDKNYHTVKLLIHKKDHRLYSAEAFGKQAVNHTVILKDYQRRIKTDEDTFVFDPADHPGVEVVDTRF